ncbi:hypothetical protein XELAEV_18029896mg [Xenopus laevis]|uniref:Uncharacterized protein n=1 Tax=Xenopus laevis TaxID=8355 RepID=A0A974CUM7_XENLA|nr:hypothetical protein XELAEV_18029896mg [Xenopus laevis]
MFKAIKLTILHKPYIYYIFRPIKSKLSTPGSHCKEYRLSFEYSITKCIIYTEAVYTQCAPTPYLNFSLTVQTINSNRHCSFP